MLKVVSKEVSKESSEKTTKRNLVLSQNHISGLDGLRGIAVIGVILYHMFPLTVKGGFLGVSLFFVLSGYLIAVTSEKNWEKNIFTFRSFYKKRIKRIYPSLLIIVLVTIAVLKFFAPEVLNGIRGEVSSIIFGYNNIWQIIQNSSYFAKIANASPFTHLWSLSIELQFYLIWPFIFWLYKFLNVSKFKNYSDYLFIMLSVISIAVLMILYNPEKDVSRVYYGTDTRIFSLFLGAYVGVRQKSKRYYRWSEHRKKKNILWFGICLLIVLVSFIVIDGQASITYRLGLLGSSLVFCEIIKLAVNTQLPIGNWLDCKLLSWIGKRSYEIYLWQYPVIFLFQYMKWDKHFYSIPLMIVIIIILSVWVNWVLNAVMRKINFEGKKLVYIKKAALGVMTLIIIFGICLGGYNTIIAPDSKKDSQIHLQEELEKNSKELQKQHTSKTDVTQKTERNVKANASFDYVTAVGDSVMLGASPSIKEVLPSCMIDAKESRQVSNSKDVFSSLISQGNLGSIVIIGLGTNGPFELSEGQALIDSFGKDRTIYWITAYGEHLQWQDDVNSIIYQLAKNNANVCIIDWAEIAVTHAEWFYDDGIHLSPSGQQAYADLILKSIPIEKSMENANAAVKKD